jgi:hypothetical protein
MAACAGCRGERRLLFESERLRRVPAREGERAALELEAAREASRAAVDQGVEQRVGFETVRHAPTLRFEKRRWIYFDQGGTMPFIRA